MEATGTVSGTSLRLPITWAGYRWDPARLYLADADGVHFEMTAADALESGAFDLPTDTPDRRDALQSYCEALRSGTPPSVPRVGAAEAGLG